MALLTKRDILESQLMFLLSLEQATLICVTCSFPLELHDPKHDFEGWPVQLLTDKIISQLHGCND